VLPHDAAGLQQGQHGPRFLYQHAAGFGQPDAFWAAVQQRCADHLLQPSYLMTERGLGNEHPLRGVRERARIGNCHHVSQVPELNAVRHFIVQQDGHPLRYAQPSSLSASRTGSASHACAVP